MRRWLTTLAAASLLSLSLCFAADAQIDFALSVDATTQVDATLQSMGQDVQSVAPSGSVAVKLVLTEHPVHGVVAQSVEILSGSLAVADLSWSVAGENETLTAAMTEASVSAVSSPILALATGTNTAEVPTADLSLAVAAGVLSADGTVVDHAIEVMRVFAADPRPLKLGSTATIVTTPLPSGAVAVELRIPIDEAIPVDPPFLVSYLTIDGELVLSGSAPWRVPASPHPLWVGVALLLAGLAVTRRRSLAR